VEEEGRERRDRKIKRVEEEAREKRERTIKSGRGRERKMKKSGRSREGEQRVGDQGRERREWEIKGGREKRGSDSCKQYHKRKWLLIYLSRNCFISCHKNIYTQLKKKETFRSICPSFF